MQLFKKQIVHVTIYNNANVLTFDTLECQHVSQCNDNLKYKKQLRNFDLGI